MKYYANVVYTHFLSWEGTVSRTLYFNACTIVYMQIWLLYQIVHHSKQPKEQAVPPWNNMTLILSAILATCNIWDTFVSQVSHHKAFRLQKIKFATSGLSWAGVMVAACMWLFCQCYNNSHLSRDIIFFWSYAGHSKRWSTNLSSIYALGAASKILHVC